jgi:tRNA (cytidine/uridine-2'-O-)-methyltransferase
LRRAGLDYWKYVDIRLHDSWGDFLRKHNEKQLLYFSKRAKQSYAKARYHENDFLVFGPETRGLPQELLDANQERAYRIPMMGQGVRSLNLSNAVSIVLYEALRQLEKV